MRFSAPANVSSVSLTCGEFAVVKGHVTLPKDIGEGDLAGLAANGFRRAAEDGPKEEPVVAAPIAPKAPAPAKAKASKSKA